MKRFVQYLAALAIVLLVLPFFVFRINERELAVVLRLGNPVREYNTPGVHFRLPFIEVVERMPKTLQFWGNENAAPINDVTTNDNEKIELTPWAIWRIKSPKAFVQRLRTEERAEQRVAQVTRSAIRDFMGTYDLIEMVRSSDRPLPKIDETLATLIDNNASTDLQLSADQPMTGAHGPVKFGRQKLLQKILEEVQSRLDEQDDDDTEPAIEIVDLGVSQVMFVDTVRQRIFDRWISEREAISIKIVKEGEQRKAKILNAARAEVAKIEGLGQKQANELRGRADADVIHQYAEVVKEAGDFYHFTRTLQAFESSIGPDSQLILTTDSDFFRMLKSMPKIGDTTSGAPAESAN